jgi:hypothetical protein
VHARWRAPRGALVNERIQTIVRAKGESAALSVCIDVALKEESDILSVKERGFAPQKFSKGHEVANRVTDTYGKIDKGSGRGFGGTTRDLNKGMARPDAGQASTYGRVRELPRTWLRRPQIQELSAMRAERGVTLSACVRRETVTR